MEVLNAVDEAASIHSERDPIQATVAHHTGEAVRMVGLPGSSENPLHDGLGAYTALLQGILERERTMLMMRWPFNSDLPYNGHCHRTHWHGCSPQSVFYNLYSREKETQSDRSHGLFQVTQVRVGKCQI